MIFLLIWEEGDFTGGVPEEREDKYAGGQKIWRECCRLDSGGKNVAEIRTREKSMWEKIIDENKNRTKI